MSFFSINYNINSVFDNVHPLKYEELSNAGNKNVKKHTQPPNEKKSLSQKQRVKYNTFKQLPRQDKITFAVRETSVSGNSEGSIMSP